MYRYVNAADDDEGNGYGTPNSTRKPTKKKKTPVLTEDELYDAIDLYFDNIIKDNPDLHIQSIEWPTIMNKGVDRILNYRNKYSSEDLELRNVDVTFEPDGNEHGKYDHILSYFHIHINKDARYESDPRKIVKYMYNDYAIKYIRELYDSYVNSILSDNGKGQSIDQVVSYIYDQIDEIIDTTNSKLQSVDNSWKLYVSESDQDFANYLIDAFKDGSRLTDRFYTYISYNIPYYHGLFNIMLDKYDKRIVSENKIYINIEDISSGLTNGIVSSMKKYENIVDEATDDFLNTYSKYTEESASDIILSCFDSIVIPEIEKIHPEWNLTTEENKKGDICIRLNRTNNFTYAGKEIVVSVYSYSTDPKDTIHDAYCMDAGTISKQYINDIVSKLQKSLYYRKKNYT